MLIENPAFLWPEERCMQDMHERLEPTIRDPMYGDFNVYKPGQYNPLDPLPDYDRMSDIERTHSLHGISMPDPEPLPYLPDRHDDWKDDEPFRLNSLDMCRPKDDLDYPYDSRQEDYMDDIRSVVSPYFKSRLQRDDDDY